MIRFYASFVAVVFAVLLIITIAQYQAERQKLERAREQLRDDINRAATSPDPLDRRIGRRAAVAKS